MYGGYVLLDHGLLRTVRRINTYILEVFIQLFSRFWLVKTTCTIHHNQLLLTKFEKNPLVILTKRGSRDGAVLKALASHQCGLGSIPGPGVICGLSLLLVLYSAPRGLFFLSPQKPTFANSNSIWNARTFLNEFLCLPWCSVGKQMTFTFFEPMT